MDVPLSKRVKAAAGNLKQEVERRNGTDEDGGGEEGDVDGGKLTADLSSRFAFFLWRSFVAHEMRVCELSVRCE